jgi:hypothetical protein
MPRHWMRTWKSKIPIHKLTSLACSLNWHWSSFQLRILSKELRDPYLISLSRVEFPRLHMVLTLPLPTHEIRIRASLSLRRKTTVSPDVMFIFKSFE